MVEVLVTGTEALRFKSTSASGFSKLTLFTQLRTSAQPTLELVNLDKVVRNMCDTLP